MSIVLNFPKKKKKYRIYAIYVHNARIHNNYWRRSNFDLNIEVPLIALIKKFAHFSVFYQHNSITVKNSVEPMSDSQGCAVRKRFFDCRLDQSIRFGIDSSGRFVQNEYLNE